MKNLNFKRRMLILIAGDALAIIALFIIIGRLHQTGVEIKTSRSESANHTPVNAETIKGELSKIKFQEDKLALVFPNESGLIDFANQIDELKKENVIKDFSFAGNSVVKDKTGYTGIPILINMSGSWGQIDDTLHKLNDLPYLFRPVNVKVSVSGADASVSATVNYGGFLYVNENFTKN